MKKLVAGNTLYENRGDGRFSDASDKAGKFEAGWAWGGGFIDFDNDGWEDDYSVNGFISGRSMNDTSSFFWRHAVAAAAGIEKPGSRAYQKNHMGRIYRGGLSFSGYERDGLFLNLEQGRFRDISGVSGIDSINDGRGAIFADFDNDGDLDVGVTTAQKTARLLFRNNVGHLNQSLRVTIVGEKSGREAFGAVVRVKSPLGVQTKVKSGGSGFLSSHDPRFLFGLGAGAAIEWVEVTWPTGVRQKYTGMAAGESVLIREGVATFQRVTEKKFNLVGPD